MRLIEASDLSFDQMRERFRWNVPARYNIGVDVCDRHAAVGDRTALYLENGQGETHTCTFAELRRLSDRFANALAGLGIRRGDRVGIILPQCVETAVAHIAVYKLGAVALPLSVLFGPDALAYRLADSGARALVTDAARRDLVESIRGDLDDLDHVIPCDGKPGGFQDLVGAASDAFTPADTRADDPAILIYTSGTTGPPKGALNAHRCLLGNLPGFELSHDFFPHEGDLMWSPADWAWTGGLLDVLLPALRYGVPVLGFDGGRFDPERAFSLLGKYRVRNAFIPPTALKLMMQIREGAARYGVSMRSLMSAGEQVGAEVFHWAEEAFGVKVNEMWGQTEANYLVGNCAAVMDVRPGSMGKPYPGHTVEVIDDAGNPVDDGMVGELAPRRDDPVMFLGYRGREDATREKFAGDRFRTGDLGYRDSDGYYWYKGRKDDVISSAGHRIGPGEIEDCLLKHPAVGQVAVIGAPDALRGQRVKAFVVLAPGHVGSSALVEDIQRSVRTRLAAHEYPREVEFIDALPMTATGKIRRIALREREMVRARDGGGGADSARTEMDPAPHDRARSSP